MARVTTPVGEFSRTKQSFRDEVDINSIVAKHRATGQLPLFNTKAPLHGDFSNAEDLHTTMLRVDAAEDSFQALSARVRDAAANDSTVFLQMVETQEGLDALHDAGLDLGPEFKRTPLPEPPAAPEPQKAKDQSSE